MPHNSRNISENATQQTLGSLGGCLVEGDKEQRSRERRVRRRALATSILIQTALLALLLLLPLFAKTQNLALGKTFIPIPSYGNPHRPAGPARPIQGHHPTFGGRITFFSPAARPSPSNPVESPDRPPEIGTGGNEGGGGLECSWCIDIGGKSNGPQPPQPVVATSSKPRVVRLTEINPALLIHRVEPVYPTLPRQIHKEGRVELHARIATDGTIQALEIVSGDPMFYESAKQAVLQWRYKPTVLNGQPVEIDTYITVVYTIAH